MTDDDVLLASAFCKVLTQEGNGVWWYGGADGPDDYIPIELGIDTSVGLTEEESLAVQRAMKGQK